MGAKHVCLMTKLIIDEFRRNWGIHTNAIHTHVGALARGMQEQGGQLHMVTNWIGIRHSPRPSRPSHTGITVWDKLSFSLMANPIFMKANWCKRILFRGTVSTVPKCILSRGALALNLTGKKLAVYVAVVICNFQEQATPTTNCHAL